MQPKSSTVKTWLDNKIKRTDFIPLIGEPIVLRYLDKEGKKQLILAVGKATGNTIADTTQREYHIIDSAELTEGVNSANETANEALELASAATKDVANYLIILKNMIGENGVELEDGSYFDTDDPSNCGLYKPIENSNYLDDAVSMRDADKKLDEAIGGVSDDLDELSAATASLSGTTQEYFNNIIEAAGLTTGEAGKYPGHDETHYIKDATSLDNADVLLDAAISETSDKLDDLSAATVDLSAETVALDSKLDELSANTMAADQELADRIEDLEGKEIFGEDAIVAEEDENGDTTITLKLYANEKVLSQSNQGLRSTIKLDYRPSDKRIYLRGIDDEELSHIDTDDFVKDGMLSAASVFTATEADHEQYPELVVGKTYIKLLFNVDGEVPGRANPVFISADDLVDVYTVAPESHTYMSIDEYVISLNVDQDGGLASYADVEYLSAVTDNVIKAAGLNMGGQGTYPGHDETHYIKNATSLDNADVLLDAAIYATSGLVGELSGSVVNNENVINNILAGTGLNTLDPGEYPGHDDTHYIKDATSLDNADVLLDAAIWETSGLVAAISDRLDDLSAVTESFSAHTVEALSALSKSVDDRISSGLSIISGVVEDYVEAMLSGIDFDEVYEYVDDSIEALSGSLLDYIHENEEVTAAALNNLNDRTAYIETHTTGEYIPLTNYVIATGTTEEELTIDEDDTVNEAFGKIQKQMFDNEEVVAAALNDLNDRIDSVLGNAGTLTLALNGVVQGQFAPSASTTINQTINGSNITLEGYEMASAGTPITENDTINLAFGKLERRVEDNELVTAAALNDLNNRLGDCFDGAEYDSDSKKINFYNGDTLVATIDATDFIKDGMLNNVSVVTKDGELYLRFTFNTDAGKEDIDIKVSDFAGLYSAGSGISINQENEISVKLANKGDTTYLKLDGDGLYLTGVTEIRQDLNTLSATLIDDERVIAAAFNDLNDRIIELSANSMDPDNYYTKEEVDAKIASAGTFDPSLYYTTAQTYNKTEVNNLLSSITKVNSAWTSDSAITSLSARTTLSATTSLSAITALSAKTAETAKNLDLRYITSNTMANLDFHEFLTIISTGANGTLSVASTGLPTLPANGVREAHVLIQNTSSSNIAITVTVDSRIKVTGGNVIFIEANGIGELNALITYNGSAYTIYIITT